MILLILYFSCFVLMFRSYSQLFSQALLLAVLRGLCVAKDNPGPFSHTKASPPAHGFCFKV